MPKIMSQLHFPEEQLTTQSVLWLKAVRAMQYRSSDLTAPEAQLLTAACFKRRLPASAVRVQDYQLTIHLGTEVE